MADPLLDLIRGAPATMPAPADPPAQTDAPQGGRDPLLAIIGTAHSAPPIVRLPDATEPYVPDPNIMQVHVSGSGAPAPAAQPAPVSMAGRFAQGLRDPINGGAQLLTHLLPDGVVSAGNDFNNWLADKTGLVGKLPAGGVDQQVREGEQQYQAQRAAAGSTGFDGARLAGNILNPANLAMGSAAPIGVGLGARIGLGALSGAASGAIAPVTSGDYVSEKEKQVAAGGLIGGVLPGVVGAARSLISPAASTNADLALLKGAGVTPTIGQTLGGRANTVEEKLQSVPIVGDAISLARQRALQSFNGAAINRVSGAVGQQVDNIGQDGVREAGDAVSKAYDTALDKISGVKLDGSFNQDLMQLRGMAQGLTPTMAGKFNSTINDVLLRKVSKAGSISPEDYKAVDSELGQIASRYGNSQVASEQEMGAAVDQVQALLKQQMRRSNPHVADDLDASDTGWANLVRVEGAAGSAKNNNGVFTPAQLNSAVRAADDSVRKRAVGRGTALMQDLANAGQNVLGNKVPNSGTTDRAAMAAVLGGGYALNPAIPAGILGGATLYTPWVQKLLNAAVGSRPDAAQAVSGVVGRGAPYITPGLAQFGYGLMNNQGQ